MSIRPAGASLAMAFWFWLLALACGPKTDLTDEGAGSSTSAANEKTTGVASLATLVAPSAGAADVPLNLAAVTIRFPIAVTVPNGSVTIKGAAQSVAVGVPRASVCPDSRPGTCVEIALAEALMPAATYVVAVARDIIDNQGHALPAGPFGQFVTASDVDLTAPAILGLSIQPSGPCVLVNFQTDEPAAATVVLRSGNAGRDVPAGAGTVQFAVAVSVVAFEPGNDLEIVVRARDLAGNVTESAAVTLRVPMNFLSVAITEIHANPAGPEPVEEFVEVKNLGSAPLALAGLSIEDAKGSDTLSAFTLDAGAYALIVPAAFDPVSPVDTPPMAGTRLVRVDSRLGFDGLSNGGETIRLRASDGTIVSSCNFPVDVSASKWSGKSVHRIPDDACDQAASWTHIPLAATPGWAAP